MVLAPPVWAAALRSPRGAQLRKPAAEVTFWAPDQGCWARCAWRASAEITEITYWALDQGLLACAQGVMRVAWLQDGSAWALVQAPVLGALAGAQLPDLPARHAALLDAYAAGRPSLAGVPDDGYIMQVLTRAPWCCVLLAALKAGASSVCGSADSAPHAHAG